MRRLLPQSYNSMLSRTRSYMSVVGIGVFLVDLDATIIDVALPAIRADLHLSDRSLVWIVAIYLLVLGALSPLAGRLGDLLGQRKAFLGGVAVFTTASALCGLTTSSLILVFARALQGIGAAAISNVSTALALTIFPSTEQRAHALGILSLIRIGGRSAALLLGGIIVGLLNWRWIFLINVPFGVLVYVWGTLILPASANSEGHGRPDVAGTVAIASAIAAVMFLTTSGSNLTREPAATTFLVFFALITLSGFTLIESKARNPIVPLTLFRCEGFTRANISSALFASAVFAWSVVTMLHLQLVLGYSAIRAGLAFLPANQISALFAVGLFSRLVSRFNTNHVVVAGCAIASAGLLLESMGHHSSGYTTEVLPSMLLVSIGISMASNALMLVATRNVPLSDIGSASAVVNTAALVGGTIGLGITMQLSSVRTATLLRAHYSPAAALAGGYDGALAVSGFLMLCAALCNVRLQARHFVKSNTSG